MSHVPCPASHVGVGLGAQEEEGVYHAVVVACSTSVAVDVTTSSPAHLACTRAASHISLPLLLRLELGQHGLPVARPVVVLVRVVYTVLVRVSTGTGVACNVSVLQLVE